jgi:hypothetical protein
MLDEMDGTERCVMAPDLDCGPLFAHAAVHRLHPAGDHRAQLDGVVRIDRVATGQQLVAPDNQNRFGQDAQVIQEISHGARAFDEHFPLRVPQYDLHENSSDPKLIAKVSTMAMTTSQTTTFTNFSLRMTHNSKPPILFCMNLLQRGLTNSFRGLRTGDANLFALGAAMLFVAWLRSPKPTRTQVYRKRLRPGDAVTIRFMPPAARDV